MNLKIYGKDVTVETGDAKADAYIERAVKLYREVLMDAIKQESETDDLTTLGGAVFNFYATGEVIGDQDYNEHQIQLITRYARAIDDVSNSVEANIALGAIVKGWI